MEIHITSQLQTLLFLRTLVGYLGEREQFGWWQSSFFSTSSGAFLNPIFPKTDNLARSIGVTRAASLVHDERIGIGRVYHLFRLPEEMEQGIHRILQDQDLYQGIEPHLSSKEAALTYLHALARGPIEPGVGPVRIGDTQALQQNSSWSLATATYLDAFQNGIHRYPYFSDTPR